MSKKYLLPVKRAFEINFLTQLCRVKKYFYPRKCAVCRRCRQTVRAARMFGGKEATGELRRINQEVFFYLIPRLSAMSWSLSTDSLSRANSS